MENSLRPGAMSCLMPKCRIFQQMRAFAVNATGPDLERERKKEKCPCEDSNSCND